MYGKIFDSMYEGTLYGHWEAIVTLQQMLVLCDAEGIIDITPQALAARTSIPLEIIEKGIRILSEPDQYSRTPGEDGKRIVPLEEHRPWGWQIVNYLKYRNLQSREQKREADRVRIAEKRKAKGPPGIEGGRDMSQPVADVAHGEGEGEGEAEAEAEAVLQLHANGGADSPVPVAIREIGKAPDCPHEKLVACWHEVMPELAKVKMSRWPGSTSQKNLRQRWREGLAATSGFWSFDSEAAGIAKFREFLQLCRDSDFLMGRAAPGYGRGKSFQADLHWLMVRANFDKVLSNRYHSEQAA